MNLGSVVKTHAARPEDRPSPLPSPGVRGGRQLQVRCSLRARRENTPRHPEITLVGAGLAGSLLAIYLARRGHRVTLLERRPDPRKTGASGGRSINLALANRGIAALEEVGVMASVRPALIPMAGRMLHDEQGRLRLIPYGNKPHEVIYSVSRGGLNAILLDAAESTGRVSIRFGETVTGVDFAAAGCCRKRRPTTCSSERTEAPPRSAARSWNAPADGSTRSRSATVTRSSPYLRPPGRIPDGEERPPHLAARRVHAHRAPQRGRQLHRHAVPAEQGEESFQALTTPDAVHALFARRFADAIPLMPRLTEDFFGNPTGHLETIRCAPWSFEDHALVLGDAAHAIVPFHGQGMNAAFEDCSAFDRCMEDPDRPWSEVFAEFERLRRPDTDAIADMALENYVEMRSTVREPKFQLKKDLSFRLEERHPGRFIPRYSMVMFHTLPYAEAKRRGAIQEEILDELTSRGGERRRGRPRARRPPDRRAAGDK